MAEVRYARRALRDLERLTSFAEASGEAVASASIGLIFEAVALLARHPQIGRPVEHGLRELVISRRKTGYLALYDYDADEDLVVVLAIRHQREAGYPEVDP